MLAKLGLDGHDRGVKIVARAFRDAGMEVVYMGMRVTPEQVAQTALQEDADAVGISVLSGVHMRLMPNLTRALEDRQLLGNVLLLVGGTIPQKDVEPLQALGVDGVFPRGNLHPGTSGVYKKKTSTTPGTHSSRSRRPATILQHPRRRNSPSYPVTSEKP